jgi:hypothetical protein
VRIRFGAVPDPAGVRYRAHTPKPYARPPGGCERLIKAARGVST